MSNGQIKEQFQNECFWQELLTYSLLSSENNGYIFLTNVCKCRKSEF